MLGTFWWAFPGGLGPDAGERPTSWPSLSFQDSHQVAVTLNHRVSGFQRRLYLSECVSVCACVCNSKNLGPYCHTPQKRYYLSKSYLCKQWKRFTHVVTLHKYKESLVRQCSWKQKCVFKCVSVCGWVAAGRQKKHVHRAPICKDDRAPGRGVSGKQPGGGHSPQMHLVAGCVTGPVRMIGLCLKRVVPCKLAQQI